MAQGEERMVERDPIQSDVQSDVQADGQAAGGGFERAVRPEKLADFVGQEKLRKNLGVFVKAAKSRGHPLDHVIFHGPPGLGKTTLAQIVAKELGVNFRATSGPAIEKSGDLAAILTSLEPNDVLFIDEIHRLGTAVEETLYPAMEDYKLDIIIGEGPAARTVKIDLPPFTLVAATTRTGMLSTPLRDRFGVHLRLEFYEPEDLTKIVMRAASKMGVNLAQDGAIEIARRSRGTPRIANRLLRRVWDFATVAEKAHITAQVADEALRALEVDNRGFDRGDFLYLDALLNRFDGGPVGLETLAACMGEAKDTIEDVIEPFLLQQGFIQRTPRGRLAMAEAYSHLGKTPASKKGPTAPLFD